jgi:hypothetical protein
MLLGIFSQLKIDRNKREKYFREFKSRHQNDGKKCILLSVFKRLNKACYIFYVIFTGVIDTAAVSTCMLITLQ